jgi:hypothetical protein
MSDPPPGGNNVVSKFIDPGSRTGNKPRRLSSATPPSAGGISITTGPTSLVLMKGERYTVSGFGVSVSAFLPALLTIVVFSFSIITFRDNKGHPSDVLIRSNMF